MHQSYQSVEESPTVKRTRTRFTKDQLKTLKRYFDEVCNYPNANERKSLADELGLGLTEVSHWFVNRRTAFKKKGIKINKKSELKENPQEQTEKQNAFHQNTTIPPQHPQPTMNSSTLYPTNPFYHSTSSYLPSLSFPPGPSFPPNPSYTLNSPYPSIPSYQPNPSYFPFNSYPSNPSHHPNPSYPSSFFARCQPISQSLANNIPVTYYTAQPAQVPLYSPPILRYDNPSTTPSFTAPDVNSGTEDQVQNNQKSTDSGAKDAEAEAAKQKRREIIVAQLKKMSLPAGATIIINLVDDLKENK